MKVGELCARLGMDFSQFDKDERTAKSRTQSLGSSLSGIIKNAFSFGLGMTFFSAVQRGFKATVGGAVSFNDTLEQATIGFTTMLGSARRADSFLSDLAKFAARTPFEFEGLLDASKRMMALGFAAQDVIPTMTAIGDAAAALGSGQEGIDSLITGLGNIKTQGKVTSIAMMQLARAGVPSWQILADAIGKTTGETRKLVEQGLVSADAGIAALVDGMEKRFPGMMAKMEDSWKGVTSTIKDIWSMTLGAVTKNLFGRAREWLKGVRDTISGFYDAFQVGGLSYAIEQTFGAQAAASVNTMTAALKGLWGMVTGVAGTIVRNWTLIRNLTLGVVWAFGTFKVVGIALYAAAWATNALTVATSILNGEAIKTSLTTGFLARVIQTYNLQLQLASMAGIAHVGVLQVLRTALYSLWTALGPIGWAILAISAALGIGTVVWSKYNQAVQSAAQKAQVDKMAQQQKDYQDAVNAAAQGTDNQADALGNLGKAASKNLQSFDEIHSLAADTADLSAGGLGDPLGTTPTVPFEMPEFDMSAFSFDMDAAIAEAKGNMGGFWGWVKQSASETWGKVKTWAGNVWEGAKAKWGTFKEWVGSWAGPMWDGVKDKWGSFKGWAADIWEGAKGKWGNFKDWAGRTWDGMKTKASETWGNIKTGAATGWENIKTTVGTKWDQMKANASTAWGNLKTTIGNGWDRIKSNTATKWDEIKADLNTTWANLKTDAATAWDRLKTTISNGWAKIKEGAKTWGQRIVEAFTGGMDSVDVGKAAANVTWSIERNMGFESPTKEGPGRYADQWAPNLIKMYARGLLDNLSMVQSAAGAVARSLAPMSTVPAPVFAGMSDYPSASASRSSGFGDSAFGGSSQAPMTLIVKIGERTLIDQVISGINRKSRAAGEAVITV